MSKNLFLITAFTATLLACFLGGCAAGPEESAAERQRAEADPLAIEFLVQAQDAYKMGALAPALMMADSAYHYAPDLADVHFLRGMIFGELRQYDKVEEHYQRVLELDRHYKGVYLNLGNNAMRQGQYNKALEFFEKEASTDAVSSLHTSMAYAYEKTGEIDKAIEAYQTAISADSLNPTAHMRLGQLLKDEGRLEEALAYSAQGLALDPENINYQYVVGSLFLLKGDPQSAEAPLRRVLERRPGHYWANTNLGRALVQLGRQEEGRRYLDEAEKLQEVIAEVEKWQGLAQANPDQMMLWVNLAEALHRTGNVEDAIEALQVALFINPNSFELQNNLAILFMERGDGERAVAQYHAILQRRPDAADVWLNLGVAYAEMGYFDQARQAWETALQYQPDHGDARSFLSQLPSR